MDFSSINKRILFGVLLIVAEVFIITSYLKRVNEIHIIPTIIVCIPGLIGALLLYIEKSRGRF